MKTVECVLMNLIAGYVSTRRLWRRDGDVGGMALETYL